MTPTPELQRQYDELVAAIVKAVPEIADDCWCGLSMSFCNCCKPQMRELRLEDVLRALMHHSDKRVVAVDYFGNWIRFKEWDGKSQNQWEFLDNDARWQPGKPLSDQSDETKLWLHSLLLP